MFSSRLALGPLVQLLAALGLLSTFLMAVTFGVLS
jgi:hypothetical protein